jgi:hypothetical protein
MIPQTCPDEQSGRPVIYGLECDICGKHEPTHDMSFIEYKGIVNNTSLLREGES